MPIRLFLTMLVLKWHPTIPTTMAILICHHILLMTFSILVSFHPPLPLDFLRSPNLPLLHPATCGPPAHHPVTLHLITHPLKSHHLTAPKAECLPTTGIIVAFVSALVKCIGYTI
ncbi:transmembrane protein 255A [Rhinolophus ferrumequinum]|uniref:Transmembrane protein 255A n=1 Tax=Rhinolophus ferrumequinum TaxID=59479 RepID=A0A7J8AXN0_RHIFE|nr:transmembrane protein 255A [Rhinolophus ferrumequinum]